MKTVVRGALALCLIAGAVMSCEPKDRDFGSGPAGESSEDDSVGVGGLQANDGVGDGETTLSAVDADGTGLCEANGDCTCNAEAQSCAPLPICDDGNPVSVFERMGAQAWVRTALPVNSLGAVSVSDTTLVVGADQSPADSSIDAVNGESVSVFRRADVGAQWQTDPASPLPTTIGIDENFGVSVASSGRTVFVGASEEFPGGAVYIYE